MNTVHGNLELLDNSDARWFARAQQLYQPLQQAGTTSFFGAMPGEGKPYGFASERNDGAVYAVVNPAQNVATVALPPRAREPGVDAPGRVIFRNSGFDPEMTKDSITLGPGQLAVIGFGRYAAPVYDLGLEADIAIPRAITQLQANFLPARAKNTYETVVEAPQSDDLRIVMRQRDLAGAIQRSYSHQNMGDFFAIEATQRGTKLPVVVRYNKVIWSGLSWAVGEIRHYDLTPGTPIRIRVSSASLDPVKLDAQVYRVLY